MLRFPIQILTPKPKSSNLRTVTGRTEPRGPQRVTMERKEKKKRTRPLQLLSRLFKGHRSTQSPLIEPEPVRTREQIDAAAQNLNNADLEQHRQLNINTVVQDVDLILNASLLSGSESGSLSSACDGTERCLVHLQTMVEPPQNLEQNLQQHLSSLHEDVVHQLEKLMVRLQPQGLMGCREDCCHRQVMRHLQSLLHGVTSCRSCFELMHWARHKYLSIEGFSRPDRRMIAGWNDWETKATGKLLHKVQNEVRGQLENILTNHKRQKTCSTEEDYVEFYVDVIQCTTAMREEAKKIDQELSNRVLQLCFQELHKVLKRFDSWQREFLRKKANMKEPQTIHFLKTLRMCKEIKVHIQRENLEETVEMLNQMETFTRELLTDVVVDDVKQNLQKYFKSDNKRIFPFAALEKYFPVEREKHLKFPEDDYKAVMGDIYKAIAHTYFTLLIGTSKKTLMKKWSDNIGETVAEDARMLHGIMSERAADVEQCNKLLLWIDDVLTCDCLEAMKLTVARIQSECPPQRENLLPDLLLWKGLPRRDVRTVMKALLVPLPVPSSPFWLFHFCCPCLNSSD